MIRNGYYYPTEIFQQLTHRNEAGEIVGSAQMAICIGNRTGGKTVGIGIEMIKRYEETGETCMLLSRTEKQKQGGYLKNWWNKVLNVDDDGGVLKTFREAHTITYSNSSMLVDGAAFCYCEAMSMSKQVKDEGSYDHCANIIIDEAIQKGEAFLWIYGRPAMERVFEIWQTVARGYRDAEKLTHVIFIANTSERDNWVFNDLGVNNFVRKDTKFTTQNGICVEIVKNKIAAKKVESSYMGRIMQSSATGREYYESAQNNAFSDNTAFIFPRGLDFRQLKVQLVERGQYLGVFESGDGFHVAKIEPDSRSRRICNNVKYHTCENEFEENGKWQLNLSEMYKDGRVTFQSQEAKGLFLDFCRIC